MNKIIFALASVLFFASAKAELVEVQVHEKKSIQIVYEKSSTSPKGFLLLFPGGDGRLVEQSGELSQNFLLRIRSHFSAAGFITIVVGPPSHLKDTGYGDHDRVSNERFEEINAIIERFNTKKLPIYLVGTSKGTISAMHLASAWDRPFGGVVVSSTVIKNKTLLSINVASIDEKVLAIHHESDGCPASPFPRAKKFFKERPEWQKLSFASFRGGSTESKGPCRAKTHHGFLGLEEEVTKHILNWISSG